MATIRSGSPVWAVLAPGPPQDLEAAARAALKALLHPADDHEPDWETVAADERAALVSYDKGSEGTEQVLAEALSTTVGGDVVALRFTGTGLHQVFRAGGLAQELAGRPDEALAAYGVLVPTGPVAGGREHSVCVVPGHSPDEVSRLLGFDEAPSGPLYVEPSGGRSPGSLVRSDTGGAGIFQVELSLSVDEPVYLVSTHDDGTFSVLASQAGEHTGLYEHPRPSAADYAPRLWSVAGETDPVHIARALGIPLWALGLG